MTGRGKGSDRKEGVQHRRSGGIAPIGRWRGIRTSLKSVPADRELIYLPGGLVRQVRKCSGNLWKKLTSLGCRNTIQGQLG